MNMSSDLIMTLVFAVLAGLVLYQIYAVLGRRVGVMPDDSLENPDQPVDKNYPITDHSVLEQLHSFEQAEPKFDVEEFIGGAKKAYQTIVTAFAAHNADILKPMLTPEVFSAFQSAMDQRNVIEKVQFLDEPRADLDGLKISETELLIRVRFLSEQSVQREDYEDVRRTAEIWTFQRPRGTGDLAWQLARVEAAAS